MDAISSRAFTSQARKLKVKWTEQMNNDILECKKKAQELISSENPPCNENGRKRGYIDVMKELWDNMGYKKLQLKSQNPNPKKCWLVVKPKRKVAQRKCSQGLVLTSPPRGVNTWALRWAHGPILSIMWVAR